MTRPGAMVWTCTAVAIAASALWVAQVRSQDEGKGGESPALASFNDGQVTVADLEEAIARQSVFMRRRYKDREHLEALLDKTVRFELLANEAQRRGFGDRPDVEQAVKQNAVQHLMKTEFDDKVSSEAIPEEDIKAYYEEHITEYNRPPSRRASHIKVATLEEAKSLLEELKDADLRAFRKAAREKSSDNATRLRGGDLRYFDAEGKLRGDDEASIAKPLAEAAFALEETGTMAAKPIELEDGYSVLMLTGQRPALERKLEDKDVQQAIRIRLWREQRQQAIEDYVAKLRERYKPVVHPELLHTIKLEEPEVPRGPGVPKGFPHKGKGGGTREKREAPTATK